MAVEYLHRYVACVSLRDGNVLYRDGRTMADGVASADIFRSDLGLGNPANRRVRFVDFYPCQTGLFGMQKLGINSGTCARSLSFDCVRLVFFGAQERLGGRSARRHRDRFLRDGSNFDETQQIMRVSVSFDCAVGLLYDGGVYRYRVGLNRTAESRADRLRFLRKRALRIVRRSYFRV